MYYWFCILVSSTAIVDSCSEMKHIFRNRKHCCLLIFSLFPVGQHVFCLGFFFFLLPNEVEMTLKMFTDSSWRVRGRDNSQFGLLKYGIYLALPKFGILRMNIFMMHKLLKNVHNIKIRDHVNCYTRCAISCMWEFAVPYTVLYVLPAISNCRTSI